MLATIFFLLKNLNYYVHFNYVVNLLILIILKLTITCKIQEYGFNHWALSHWIIDAYIKILNVVSLRIRKYIQNITYIKYQLNAHFNFLKNLKTYLKNFKLDVNRISSKSVASKRKQNNKELYPNIVYFRYNHTCAILHVLLYLDSGTYFIVSF